jgi:hypothetical protein
LRDAGDISPLKGAILSRLVPVGNLEAKKDAEDNDDKVNADGKPIVPPNVQHELAKQHNLSQTLPLSVSAPVPRCLASKRS